MGTARRGEASPLQAGGGHVLRQEGAGQVQVVARVRIAVRDLSKTFGAGPREVAAVSRVSFDVHDKEFVAIVGPSGCGKSTILNMIGSLLGPSGGGVLGDRAPGR